MILVSAAEPRTGLPEWNAVLAVVAHPDDESFGLGAVLDAFARSGTRTTVLCLTRGEASTIHGVSGDLTAVRAGELEKAARALGVSATELADHPDGALATIDRDVLAAEVSAAAARHDAEGLLVFDPSGISGHPDHVAATAAALSAAEHDGLPVLAWTLPRAVSDQLRQEFGVPFDGHDDAEIDVVLPVTRDRQRVASLAHASQAIPTSVLWRRLELLGDREHLRRLR
ncbi:MAG: PIG-L family deacetylase [Humibacillus sp.]|nr:PIG-L family deacetylase [Humibacillus sp.]MDN5776824.1 PIG-L family deacetylase [Humibacillus sp.]